MTVTNPVLRNPYTCDGVQTVFDYDNYIDNKEVLKVVLYSGDTPTELQVDSDYTVSGVGSDNGGTITLNTAPTLGTKLVILYDYPLTQTFDLTNAERVFTEDHEKALDRIIYAVITLAEKVERSLLVPPDSDMSTSDLNEYLSQVALYSQQAQDARDESEDASAESTAAKDDAVEAKVAAELAKAQAEAAKTLAEGFKDSAESAKDDSVAAKTLAESARDLASGYKDTALTAASDALSYRNSASAIVDGFSAGAVVGYATLAELNADLAKNAGTVGWVMNDPTSSNNGTYRKVGASGTGSWVQASTDRVVSLETKVGVLQGYLQANDNPDWPIVIADSNDRIAAAVSSSGKVFIYGAVQLPLDTTIVGSANPISSRLLPGDTGTSFESEISNQYAFMVADQTGAIKFAVPFDGHIIGRVTEANVAYGLSGASITYDMLSSSLKTQLASNNIVAQLVGSNLYTENRTTGKRVLISQSASSEYDIIDNAYIVYRESGSWLYKPVTGGSAKQVLPNSPFRLVTYGDSLTASSQGVSATAAFLASTYPGLTGSNKGASGYGVADIAIRQGGLTVYFNAASDQIPASGSVALTLVNSPTTGYRTNSVITFSGTLAGVSGTLTKAADGTWSFARSSSGSVVSCPPGTPFVCATWAGTENDIQSIWMGRNNVGAATFQQDTLDNVARCVAFMGPLFKRYVIISVTNGTSEGVGTSNYNSIIACNNALKNVYGDRFYDLRADFIQNGLAKVGITPTSQDLIDIAADRPPSSLMGDSIHPNADGYNAQKQLFADWLINKGYFI